MNTAPRKRILTAILGLTLVASATAQVKATGGWIRATPPGTKVAAAYLTLTNTSAVEHRLLRAVSTVSDRITVHRTSMTSEGVSKMWPMAVLAVQPGETLRMEPNALHVMFNDLKAPLVAGQKVPLTMKFDGGAPEFTVMLEVRPLVPAADGHAHH
jgi:copper(I)-binding protein